VRSFAGEGAPTGGGADPAALERVILEKTEGNPLFMEEIVLDLFEDGTLARNGEVKLTRPLTSLRIPPTVQGIIASRIDRLRMNEKDLLQSAAVIGSEFTLGVARAVTGKSDDELNGILNNLQLAEFIYEQPATSDVEYTFKHALTHDVAYNSLLTERRKLLHQRTAQAIEEVFGGRLEDHLSELAHHFDRSDNVPKAVEYLGRTGLRVAQQLAHSEAIGYFTRALELLQKLPDGTERDHQELDLQMALSWSLLAARGYEPSPERKSALSRSRELSEQLGDKLKLMEALLALAQFQINRGDLEHAKELAERVINIAEKAEAPVMLAGAHFVLGLVRFASGQFLVAREHLERAVELFGPPRSYGSYLSAFSRIAFSFLSATLVIVGYPSTALSRRDELLTAARLSSDPAATANALASDLLRHLLLRDPGMVAERADELLSIAHEHGIPFFLTLGTFCRGWAMSGAGRSLEGLAEMRRGILDSSVARLSATAFLLLVTLAETCGKNGNTEEGLDLVTKGLMTAEQTGLRGHEAELHRLRGELLMIKAPGNVIGAERCLRTAIDVACSQGARLFQLRATVSLARLMANQDCRDETRRMLAEIYNWFTEGFDLPDLREAKALLDELNC
jgi:tetratricopeptide (TPR) repeat protein